MAQNISLPSVTLPLGLSAFEIDTPTRVNGARLTITRLGWPPGPVFNAKIFERERGGELSLLWSVEAEKGGTFGKDGTPNPPLIVELNWRADKDKDRIRIELEALVIFTAGIQVEWLT